jgi:hypothetical protein
LSAGSATAARRTGPVRPRGAPAGRHDAGGPAAGRHHKSRTHPAGLSTDSLFFQSNLGIVVGARLRLRIRQEAEDAVVVQGEFAPVIAALKRAYDDNLLVNPTHVAEPGRAQRLGASGS